MRIQRAATIWTGVATVTAASFGLVYGCSSAPGSACSDNANCQVGSDATADAVGDGSVSADGVSEGSVYDGGGGDVHPGEAGCPSPTTLDCNGTCVDPTLPAHCGTCSNVCTGPDSGMGAATCTSGTCSFGCSGTTSDNCGGACVDDQTDPLHCGSCTNICSGPEAGLGTPTCAGGGCGVTCAPDGGTPLQCPGSLCVNPSLDPLNCGGCSNACAVPPNGMAACAPGPDGGGSCGVTCSSGYHPSGAGCNATCAANTVDPSVDPCVVANGLGTFVSADGSDAVGCGTMASPCATIANAMSVSLATTKRVYACGSFSTNVVVPAGDDGVTVYGGFTCGTWAYSPSTPTTVAPTTTGYALEVTSADTNGVAFHDFVFTAQGAPQTASATPASSVAIFASGAKLTLTRVAVNAGAGQPGVAGTTTSNYSGTTAQGGDAATILAGGGGGSATCDDHSTSTGGTGGYYNSATVATPGLSNGSSAGTGTGGQTGGTSCSPGGLGSSGAPGSPVGAGVSSSGALGSTGWAPGPSGGDGQNGGPAQGGGGGGANDSGSIGVGGSGGGGGAGGCGGGAGTGGQTGGSSIAILSYQSTVVTSSTSIVTTNGGAGGAGGPGQVGQSGGGPGSGACPGGTGGTGGEGAAGGGGAGGLSAGIVWSGTSAQAPSFNGMTYTTQAAPITGITLGSQGTGGGNGATPPANAIYESN